MEDISIWQKTGHFYFALTPHAATHQEVEVDTYITVIYNMMR